MYAATSVAWDTVITGKSLQLMNKFAKIAHSKEMGQFLQKTANALNKAPELEAVTVEGLAVKAVQNTEICALSEAGENIKQSTKNFKTLSESAKAKTTQIVEHINPIEQTTKPSIELPQNTISKIEVKNLAQLSSLATEEAIKYVMKNKIVHIFQKAEHNLGPLVSKMGGYENTIRAILKNSNNKLPMSGLFLDIPITVNNFTVYIRGHVMDGVPKIGTMYIK